MPKLIVSGTPHELVEQVVTIGRSPENMIQLDDPSVSGRHAELRAIDKTFRLRDLGSTNGTHVNGSATREVVLRHGDRIRFGGVQARFEADVVISATQPLPVAEKVQSKVASTSMRPAGFANASPFRPRDRQRDNARRMLFLALGIAVLALVAALMAVLTMHAGVP